MTNFPKDIFVKPGRPSGYANLRSAEGDDIGDVPEGTRLRALGVDAKGRFIVEAFIAPEVVQEHDPDTHWLYPVDGPVHVTSPFNVARPWGKHEGIDLRAALGVRVRAVADGEVVKLWKWHPGIVKGSDAYGNWLIVKHYDGYSTVYCHLDRFATDLAVGVHVIRDQTLGYAGSTGNSSAAHLHFMATHPIVGRGGYVFPKVVDPAPLLGLP